MKITMVKLLAVVGAGCFLLGVTLAAETNKHQPQKEHQQPQQLGRNKRGLLSALFGGGDEPPTVADVPTEVLPIYGDPAQPPLHMLYGHATGVPGPYPPYPMMFVPGPLPPNEGSFPGPYLPVLAYGGVGSGPGAQLQPAGDSNYLPAVIGWPEASPPPSQEQSPVEVTTRKSQETTPAAQVDPSKSAYLQKLNLSPADEAELKRLAQQLGVTDFEHLPPFEDVMALLGTTTSAETIKAIKEYASTPDGLELIRDYVMSYQPAKRISLGQEPYSANGLGEGSDSDAETSTTVAPVPESGFFAHHLRRLKSLLTFGYFGSSDVPMPLESLPEDDQPVVPVEVTSEAPFVRNDAFPAFELRDGGLQGSQFPVGHYLIPVRALPHHSSYPNFKYASTVPFPLAFHYPPESQHPNPFTVQTAARQAGPQRLGPMFSSPTPTDTYRLESAVPPQRVAPPTQATGEVHTFESPDIEQTVRTTAVPVGQLPELTASSTSEPILATFAPIVVEPELTDTTELASNALDVEH